MRAQPADARSREVWITGMAWITALGSDIDKVWAALLAGATGVHNVPSNYPLRNEDAAVLREPSLIVDPVDRQHLIAKETLLAALSDARVSAIDPRVQPIVGTSYGAHLDNDGVTSLDRWCVAATEELGMPRRPIAVSTACSSGSDSLLIGTELIRGGKEEICVCGAVDILTPSKRIGHSVLGTMSPTSLRAFDIRHDGTVLGEGAAFLVLESGASARARGARPHGYLLGAGSANDATSAAAPDPSGDSVVRAVERAMRSADRSPTDVAVINAHGSGTGSNDQVESRSYGRLFARAGVASARPVVFATKGAFGHSLGATGALEAIAVLLAVRDGVVPAVHGLGTVMPGFALPLPVRQPMEFSGQCGLSVTLGFGGFNTCLVFEGAK
jgi:3-oxoacyl-[acyl-carrier-protein] synthase II